MKARENKSIESTRVKGLYECASNMNSSVCTELACDRDCVFLCLLSTSVYYSILKYMKYCQIKNTYKDPVTALISFEPVWGPPSRRVFNSVSSRWRRVSHLGLL